MSEMARSAKWHRLHVVIILFSTTIITTISDIVSSITAIVITIITSTFAITIISALGFRARQFRAAFLSNLARALFRHSYGERRMMWRFVEVVGFCIKFWRG